MTYAVLRPIETIYKGYRFRSRLEARWAVFFDRCKQKWTYEDQGYHLPSGPYLPDFFFSKYPAFVEVKALAQLPTRNFEFDILKSAVPIDDDFPREIILALEMTRSMQLQDGYFVICYGDPLDVITSTATCVSITRSGPRANSIGFIDLFPASLFSAADAARAARFEHGEGR
jgi:hypothetical protein